MLLAAEAVDGVIIPVLVSLLTLLIGAAVLWLVRAVGKVMTHVLPHFDPARAEALDMQTIPARISELEDVCRAQADRLANHLDDEEAQNGRTADAIDGLRSDVQSVSARVDRVLGPGNVEVRRG